MTSFNLLIFLAAAVMILLGLGQKTMAIEKSGTKMGLGLWLAVVLATLQITVWMSVCAHAFGFTSGATQPATQDVILCTALFFIIANVVCGVQLRREWYLHVKRRWVSAMATISMWIHFLFWISMPTIVPPQ